MSVAAASKPRHIAIIMDGNGRWAERRGMSRIEGHRAGATAALETVKAAAAAGIEYLTLFSFSSENWNRPEEEVNGLMSLLRLYLQKEIAEMNSNGVRLKVIGERVRLPEDIRKLIDHAETLTQDNTRITVVIALSYGGRQDIAHAARALATAIQSGTLAPEDIDETVLSNHLMTAGIPDPDLMIRTSGEYRISNFLLWQLAYAEMFFTDTLWPDFGAADLEQALAFFVGRERRFGGIPARAVTAEGK